MFWKFDLNTTSHIDKLLEKEGVTLRELMDEDDILQECKAQNRKLLDFLCRQQCMEELVSLISQDPPLDMEEKVRFKYPNTACELLTSDVPQINDKLGGDETLLNLLYDFLDHEPPLNPLLASFFSKTIGNLIARKTEQVIVFLKKKVKFINLVLRHLGTSAMMDLLLRLVSCVEPASLRQEVLHWLNEEMVIQRLVELIHPGQDEDRQSNASQTLCDIIRLGRDQSGQLQETSEPDPLLAVLESQDCVEQLLKNMFDGDQTESCLVNGMQVLLTLLETRRVGAEGLVDTFSQGLERSHTVNSSILHGIMPRLKDFHQLLLSPPKKQAILTTIGMLEEPLGNARLHGARLMAALLHTNTPSINQELCRLSTMDLLLVSTHHLHSSSEDEDIESAFPNELSLQQAFSEYQVQQMTANFVDQFGFNDEEFADQDDNIKGRAHGGARPAAAARHTVSRSAPFDRIAEITFHVEAEGDSPHASLFEACCGDRIQPFDDPEDDDDIWEDRGPDRVARGVARARFGVAQASESCSKAGPEHGAQDTGADAAPARAVSGGGAPQARGCRSPGTPGPAQREGPREEAEEEGGHPTSSAVPRMPLPTGARWTAVFDEPASSGPAPAAAVDVGSSVWMDSAPSASAPEEEGWAKFADFPPFCCSEAGPRCSSPVDRRPADTEHPGSQCPEEALSPASPCAWDVCTPRKAPLVASDSSSPGSSDSEDDKQKAGVIQESPLPTPGAGPEGADMHRSEPTGLTSPDPTEGTALPAGVVPPGPTVVVSTAALSGTATKDRLAEAPLLAATAAANGPI
ncbi:serine/threonine-protein phosphatase 6 regulatory subunit 2 isoform X6 [Tamandua tetradactyla]|uniref:serine/threonine-protein phosphatase 6 regulatory subunit 2 isoform X6 n=1 Tax=Tamandua tetradactyla TaxID=48850 RepID=UPI004054824E